MKATLKEQINKALSNSHGSRFTYDYLFKDEPSDKSEDRCSSTHSIEQFESEFEGLVNNQTPYITIYIQVDDCDAFKAECEKAEEEDMPIEGSEAIARTFTIGASQVNIVID